ncbi:MAG: roadblock/LC7 domain-containing protein [Candidatus Lokiarchaeota archaeon]|jgi:predicted regulator of Ras-like GTPase activity (Roadblock/LC7/MglB family)
MGILKENEIKKILEDLRKRTDIFHSILFSIDGFIITLDQAFTAEGSDNFQSLGAVCAGIVALAGNSVENINENNKIKQICVQAGNQLESDAFQIIIESVSDDVLLAIVFPTIANFGVILFELKQTISKLQKYFLHTSNNKTAESLSV